MEIYLIRINNNSDQLILSTFSSLNHLLCICSSIHIHTYVALLAVHASCSNYVGLHDAMFITSSKELWNAVNTTH